MISEKALHRSADILVTPAQFKDPAYEFAGETTSVLEWLQKEEIGAWVRDEHDYHYKLHRCSGKPPVVYRKGNPDLLHQPILALVGPRKPSNYLRDLTEELFDVLPRYQLCTISGGAQGIDEMTHLLSVQHDIPTIVVLGGGFRRYRQQRHRKFFQKILDAGGLIMSERKLDQEPTTYTFPQRNRLIATLADAVFVPGAGKKSGSLITVDFAVKYGIPVVTVPGSKYELSCAGTNDYLIQKKITGTIDFSAFLGNYFTLNQQQKIDYPLPELSDLQHRIITLLETKTYTVPELATALSLEVGVILEQLVYLEMQQLIESPEPQRYVRKGAKN